MKYNYMYILKSLRTSLAVDGHGTFMQLFQ